MIGNNPVRAWAGRARAIVACATALLAAGLGADAGHGTTPAAAARVEVFGTSFRVTTTDGRLLQGSDLLGAVLTLGDDADHRVELRIDDRRPDPRDPTGETILYTLMVREPASGEWRNLCRADPDGVAMGFPVAGLSDKPGREGREPGRFSLTCTSGATGKCVRMGYKPWKTMPDGTSLRPYHTACTRMLRADYCGDGVPHTRDGTPINIYDRLGIQVADRAPSMVFEAAWGPDGAVCVSRVRVPDVATLDAVERACPARLGGRIGPQACGADAAGALLFNDSVERTAAGPQ
jgi:hypothetical protein